MGKFNLSDYDQVEDRIKKFYDNNKDGRITTKVVYQDGERTMVKAYIYLSREDQEKKCPKATGIAEEERVGKQMGSKGEYEPVNFSSWTENCETSAIGRALANMNMSGNKRPSRQEMEKVQRYSNNSSVIPRGTTAPRGDDLEPATDSQIYVIKKQGLEIKEGLTKSEASEIISKFKGN